jgi:hypothetical protein
MKLEFSQWIFKKYSNIKFHENPSSGSRVLQRGQKDGHTDMTNLRVSFRIFVNVPKKGERLQPRPEETYSASMFSAAYGKVPIGSNHLFSPHPTVLITHAPPILPV